MENKLEKSALWNGLTKFLRFGLVASSCLVTLITFGSVIMRALNMNFLGYEEILIICAFWLYMIGTAYGSYEDSHIKADVIVVMMPDGFTKSLLAIIRNTLSLILGFVFFLWAFQLFSWTIEMGNKTPVWRIPMTVSQSSLLFGLTFATFYNLVYLYDEIKAFINKYIKKNNSAGSPSDDIKEV